MMKGRIYLTVVLLLFGATGIFGQQVIFQEDFEKGPATPISKIKRYPMDPQVVDSDPTFPGAFPPPSGRYAARAQDTRKNYYGLGSIVAGPEIDLTNPAQQYAALEAKIYLNPSSDSDIANCALIALDDSGATEKYYRFGYARSSVYYHYFSGNTFTESLYDPDLGEKLSIPGWHTFTMRFDGPGRVFLYVDGQQAFYSPVEQRDVVRFRIGVLGWDRYESRPILGDDFKVTLYSEPPAKEGRVPVSAPPERIRSAVTPRPQPDQTPAPVRTAEPPSPAGAQTPVWFTDTNKAVESSKASGKKFLVLFYLEGHPLTQQIEQQVLANPLVQQTIGKFVLVKLEGRQNPELSKRYGIFKYPALIVIDMQGRIYWQYNGVITTETLNRSLARF